MLIEQEVYFLMELQLLILVSDWLFSFLWKSWSASLIETLHKAND